MRSVSERERERKLKPGKHIANTFQCHFTKTLHNSLIYKPINSKNYTLAVIYIYISAVLCAAQALIRVHVYKIEFKFLLKWSRIFFSLSEHWHFYLLYPTTTTTTSISRLGGIHNMICCKIAFSKRNFNFRCTLKFQLIQLEMVSFVRAIVHTFGLSPFNFFFFYLYNFSYFFIFLPFRTTADVTTLAK